MRRFLLLFSVTAFVATGCFRLQPVAGSAVPETGAKVAVHLNDLGRAALSGTVGNAIERIEGTLTEQGTDGYSISVQHVYFLQGGVQIWSGETVRVGKDQVQSFSLRRLARGRTIAVGAVGVGSVAFMLSRGLFGFGFGPADVPSDTGETLRLIWP